MDYNDSFEFTVDANVWMRSESTRFITFSIKICAQNLYHKKTVKDFRHFFDHILQLKLPRRPHVRYEVSYDFNFWGGLMWEYTHEECDELENTKIIEDLIENFKDIIDKKEDYQLYIVEMSIKNVLYK